MSNESKLWCGIDISKNTFDASLVTDQRVKDISAIPVDHFEHTAEGISVFLAWLHRHCQKHNIGFSQVHFILEATGKYSLVFNGELRLQVRNPMVSIVNPAHAANFQKSLGIRSKTDSLDARSLGIFGRERKPDAYEAQPPHCQALQELFRQRSYYVGQRVAQEARLREAITATVKKIESDAVKSTKKTIATIEAEIKKLLNREHRLGRDVKLLMTIPGVGLLTATGVLAELGDLRRFARAAELSSFTGLAPQLRESGTSVRYRSRISKAGNNLIRKYIYMAALTLTKKPKEGLGVFYARLVAAGKPKKTALLAVARKLLVLMRALLISGNPYEERLGAKDRKMLSVGTMWRSGGKLRQEPRF